MPISPRVNANMQVVKPIMQRDKSATTMRSQGNRSWKKSRMGGTTPQTHSTSRGNFTPNKSINGERIAVTPRAFDQLTNFSKKVPK